MTISKLDVRNLSEAIVSIVRSLNLPTTIVLETRSNPTTYTILHATLKQAETSCGNVIMSTTNTREAYRYLSGIRDSLTLLQNTATTN